MSAEKLHSADKATKRRQRPTCSTECRLRAKEIFQSSLGVATNKVIAEQLQAEGFKPAPVANDIAAWKKAKGWSDPIHSPIAADISEDLRQAVQLRMPDDLERIERSSFAFEALTQQCANWLRTQVQNVKVETPEQFEIMTRCCRELMLTHLAVGKSLQDLRLLRVSSAFGEGEIIPPTRRGGEDAPVVSDQDRVISNFAGA